MFNDLGLFFYMRWNYYLTLFIKVYNGFADCFPVDDYISYIIGLSILSDHDRLFFFSLDFIFLIVYCRLFYFKCHCIVCTRKGNLNSVGLYKKVLMLWLINDLNTVLWYFLRK